MKLVHTVTLIHSPSVWLAKHSDPAIAELFGTDTLPTVFHGSAEPETVLEHMKAHAPDCRVSLSVPVETVWYETVTNEEGYSQNMRRSRVLQ